MIPKLKWKMSKKHRALLAEERLKSEREYIAKILEKKKARKALNGHGPARSVDPASH
jgi:hypothetical protein